MVPILAIAYYMLKLQYYINNATKKYILIMKMQLKMT